MAIGNSSGLVYVIINFQTKGQVILREFVGIRKGVKNIKVEPV